ELVGTLAHPLNRACFDPLRQVVIRGYGILQPRVGISMSGQSRSRFVRLYGSEPGIDPYTRAVSDVYQDLFSEGSFVGKGIYDVDAFEHALAGRMPDNRILSHDLLEGCYARAGLVSDVQLYEDYPARYAVDVKRRHRWIRGDWQLLPWLWPRVPAPGGRGENNPLSMLSRAKLADNLRRSLVPAAIAALLVLGWLLAAQPGWWTLAVLSILLVPPLLASLTDLARRPRDLPLRAHLRQATAATLRNFAQAPVTLACLPYEAFFTLDAISRTLWRMLATRRHLLQWSPSSEVERTLGDGLAGSLRSMWFAPAFAIAVAVAVAAVQPGALAVAMPVLVLWLLSPVLMWWLGRPRARRTATLSWGVLLEARGDAPADNALAAFGRLLETAVAAPPSQLTDALRLFEALATQADAIKRGVDGLAGEIEHWAETLSRQCGWIQEELSWLAPWLETSRDAIPTGQLPWSDRIPTLREVAQAGVAETNDGDGATVLSEAAARACARIAELERLAHAAGQFAQMDYEFLYDRARHLLTIGYNVDEHRRDQGYYDLLASEARLCSFVAIAQGQLPQDTWFALGRLLTEVDGDPTLLSWSGSMFEYLMPLLVMPSYEGTLLDQTARNCVQRQIDYGRQRGVPWGMSESGYNIVDARMNYQYRAFGVPGLGLKRGLAQDLVIAPYASMMALMVAPEAACENLQRLTEAGFSGRFGLYEAIDYTPARLPRGQN
ncbi:MAG: carbohydrate-binding protein, partial [Gammaproteobacteria bacterium]|nr:carbohydrate-binding protein [Gammaproteobacteria bacterium]